MTTAETFVRLYTTGKTVRLGFWNYVPKGSPLATRI